MEINDLVTLDLGLNNKSSNTFIVKYIVGEDLILQHPLSEELCIVRNRDSVNRVVANLKDSTERGLYFCKKNEKYLDFNEIAELEALIMYFVVKRSFSPRQKKSLSTLLGKISSAYFYGDISSAMKLINDSKGVLDDFNTMWVNKFDKILKGERPIVSKNQRAAIFNISGCILAELEAQIA